MSRRPILRTLARTLSLVASGALIAMLAVAAGAHGGDPTLIHACVKDANPNRGSVRIVDPGVTCPAGYSNVDWGGLPEELVVIQNSEFDMTEPFFETTTDWEVIVSGGADLIFDPTNSVITMDTQQPPYTAGEVVVRGRRSASVNDGSLVFTTGVLDAYAEQSGNVYGNAQPRGLANGTNRNNAIEFINVAAVGAQEVGCRTVSGGSVTQTNVDIGQWVRLPAVYEIVAKPTAVKFYVNGALVCTHTTNIPTTPLNIYYATSDGGAGNVPMVIDWVSFGRRAA